MPTGYTAVLNEKDISFNEFVLRCSRNFGACISMRDESLDKLPPEKFEVEVYYANKIKELEDNLLKLKGLSDSEIDTMYEDNFNKKITYYNESLLKNKILLDRYNNMLQKVIDWTPPTNDHVGLKEFMVEQLISSIRFDFYEMEEPKRTKVYLYHKEEIEGIEKDLDYYNKKLEAETKRVDSRNKWLEQSRRALQNDISN